MKIALGSTSHHKVGALQDALARLALPYEVQPIAAPSSVDAQPIGADVAALGAENRARYAAEAIGGQYAVGIESGIEWRRGHWVDITTVVVLRRASEGVQWSVAGFATSTGIPFPAEYVRRCIEAGPRDHTVGEFMAAEMGGSATDGTATLTGGRLTRRGMLVDAVAVALLQATA